jgi:phospholipid/cholesterol/gamma-HCH transport system permease protein
MGWISERLETVGGFSSLVRRAFARTFRSDPNHFWLHLEELGVDAWPIIGITAFFTGAVLALQTGIAFIDFDMRGATMFIPKIVTKSMVLELGPVFSALVLAGRSGSAIGAQVASMNVSEQVHALRALAIDSISYLVTPRILALALALPCLAVLADLLGIVGGLVYCWSMLDMSSGEYIRRVLESLLLRDLLTSTIKCSIWGAVIAAVGCYMGLKARRGVVGVGQATRGTVVVSTIIILISDFFLTRFLRIIIKAFV